MSHVQTGLLREAYGAFVGKALIKQVTIFLLLRHDVTRWMLYGAWTVAPANVASGNFTSSTVDYHFLLGTLRNAKLE